jgi:GalNAc5-diNAcBac-PP-undecaprenol beta-1,3-glucosyltransferase
VSLAATVLIPTHDHGPTLLRSVPSALAQTVTELEVFVVGDGAPDETRKLMAELAAADKRVRFFDNPKGERHGEAHRHAVLQEARGEIVCYLSDDDLWLPGHIAHMRELLSEADVASALSFLVDPDGQLHVSRTDLGRAYYRELVLGGENRTDLSVLGHTLDFYRRLPSGWTPGPAESASDLHFTQQLLSQPGCVARSGSRPTVWHFPSPMRSDWSPAQRLVELDDWAERLASAEELFELACRLLEATLPDRAWLEEAWQLERAEARRLLAEHEALSERLRGLELG